MEHAVVGPGKYDRGVFIIGNNGRPRVDDGPQEPGPLVCGISILVFVIGVISSYIVYNLVPLVGLGRRKAKPSEGQACVIGFKSVRGMAQWAIRLSCQKCIDIPV